MEVVEVGMGREEPGWLDWAGERWREDGEGC